MKERSQSVGLPPKSFRPLTLPSLLPFLPSFLATVVRRGDKDGHADPGVGERRHGSLC